MKYRPERSRRDPCKEGLRLKIGPLTFALEFRDCRVREWPHPFYEPFVAEEGQDLTLRVHGEPPPSQAAGDCIFDAGNHWKLKRGMGALRFETFHPLHGSLQSVGLLNGDLSCCDCFLAARKNGTVSVTVPAVMQPLGQWLLVQRLARHRGGLIHGLGVAVSDAGIAFVGPSGAGKTTLCRLFQERRAGEILSDENISVYGKDGAFHLSGTPWPGAGFAASARSVPLRKVYFIKHGPQNKVEALSRNQAFRKLAAQLYLPMADPESLAQSLRFAQQLLEQVPCAELAFLPDARIVDEILKEEA